MDRLCEEWINKRNLRSIPCIRYDVIPTGEVGVYTIDHTSGRPSKTSALVPKEGKMKNAMFQFASKNEVFEDAGLITFEEAEAMFRDNIQKFITEFEMDREPEMCIWINCDSNTDYRQTYEHWCAEDLCLSGGDLWKRV